MHLFIGIRKITYLILCLFCLLLAGCNSRDQVQSSGLFSIRGKVQFNTSDSLTLYKYQSGNFVKVVATKPEPDGQFSLQGLIPQKDFYRLALGKDYLDLPLDFDPVVLNITGEPGMAVFSATGSVLMDEFQQYRKLEFEFNQKVNAINQQYILAQNMRDDALSRQLMVQYQEENKKFISITKKFVATNPQSLVSLWAVYNVYSPENISLVDSMITAFESRPLSKSVLHALLKEQVAMLRNTTPGQKVLPFGLPDAQGNKVSFEDFKGKFLVVDFWASWCGPCRKENPEMVQLYRDFRDKNVAFLGVSLDDDKNKWLNAIKEDKLEWPHISDLKGWESAAVSAFGIEGIPYTLLLDTDGVLIAKGLRSKELRMALENLTLKKIN